eukprot:TRINITY_DN8020_c0_g1_i1.p1 TRINITY_DN8020_c0_g1~~TRINITY_DN8020_c0_g1_i1.p1  ORF type:complete len:164 (-),score=23.74 TRINITY_DN8020_c0_g1_i1:138-629(-)
MNSLTQLVNSKFGTQPPAEPPSFLDEISSSTQLGFKKRLTLAVTLMVLGLFFCGISTTLLLSPKKFAKLYTIGSLFIVGGVITLSGLKKVISNITSSSDRLTATLVYLGSMVGTLYAALSLKNSILTLLMVLIQFASALWYTLSYVPFGHQLIKRVVRPILPI